MQTMRREHTLRYRQQADTLRNFRRSGAERPIKSVIAKASRQTLVLEETPRLAQTQRSRMAPRKRSTTQELMNTAPAAATELGVCAFRRGALLTTESEGSASFKEVF
jgi:hypothetical protein